MRALRTAIIVLLLPLALTLCTSSSPGDIRVSLKGPTRIKAGDLLTLRATLSSGEGPPSWSSISWGDGTQKVLAVYSGPVCLPGRTPSPSSSRLPPGSSTLLFEHRYRLPGRYTVALKASHPSSCASKSISGTGTGRWVIEVAGPAAPGNGVADPDPGVGLYRYKHGFVHGDFDAVDPDGYIRSITVTWPGGATQTYLNSAPCHDPGNSWPQSQVQFFWARRLKPGTYSITARAVSTDCKGGAVQVLTDIRPFLLTKSGWSNDGRNVYLPHEPRGNGMLSQGVPACCPIRELTGS
jgi:hypothetical protein